MGNKMYIGIDVGSKGVITTQYNGEFKHYYIEDMDLYQLSEMMAEIRSKNDNIACVVEDVQAICGSAAGATFTFGFNKGYLIGLLAANKIPYTLVRAKEWQKIWSNADMVVEYKKVKIKDKKTKELVEVTRKSTNTKQTSYNTAKRLFPSMDFKKSARCKNFHDGVVDSLLMSEYARRNNL